MAGKEVDSLHWFREVSSCQTNRVGRGGQVYEVTWLHGGPGKWDHLFRKRRFVVQYEPVDL
jgi:hypothetical protein